MKKGEKNVVAILARRSYQANKKQNIFIIIAILLTTFMFTAIFNIGISYWEAINKRSIAIEGMKYDISLTEPTEEQSEKAKDLKEILYAGLSVKCAIIQEYNSTPLSVRLFWSDKTNWEKQCIPAFEFVKGIYPESENEIMLSTKVLKQLDISSPKIGMKIPVTYGALAGDEKSKEVEFVLSGYYRDYTGDSKGFVSEKFYNSTGVKQTDISQGSLIITLKNHLYSRDDINLLEQGFGLEGTQVIRADTNSITIFYRLLLCLAVLFLLIMLSGYLFIYNTFYISIAKEIRFYGQVKTLGMETKQMKSIFYSWIFWNSGIGITLGLLLGGVVSYVCMPLLLKISNSSLDAKGILEIIHPSILLGAALFSFITIWISTYKPIRIAIEISPIEAAKYNGINAKVKKRKSVNGAKLFKMAWRNIFREKKQAFIIFTSFIVTLTTCISINQIIKGNTAESILNHFYNYDIRILNNTCGEDMSSPIITDSQISAIQKTKEVSSVKKVLSAKVVIPYNEKYFGNYFKEYYEIPGMGEYEEEIAAYKENPESDYYLGKIVGVDEIGAKEIIESLNGSVDLESFLKGKVGIINTSYGISAKEVIGRNLSFYFPTDQTKTSYSVKIEDEYLNSDLYYFSAGNAPTIIVSEELFNKLVSEPIVEVVDVDYSKSYNKNLDNVIENIFSSEKEVTFDSKMDDYNEMKQSENQIKILGRGIGIILAFLAILNFFNMILTSIQSRTKEFAVMESIGLTSKQLHKLLIYEGLLYGIISMILSISIGGPISYFVYQAQNKYNIPFYVPVFEDVIIFVGILIICMGIPIMTYRFSRRKSVIEELRTIE